MRDDQNWADAFRHLDLSSAHESRMDMTREPFLIPLSQNMTIEMPDDTVDE